MNKGVIYMLESPSGKQYIGQTINFKHRMIRHRRDKKDNLISRAIHKYGFDKFKITILYDDVIEELLDEYEIHAIKEHNTLKPEGYNMAPGGSTNAMKDPEVSKKVSIALLEQSAKGEHSSQRPEIQEQIAKTLKEQGAKGELPCQQPEIKAKIKKTRLEQGVKGEHSSQQPEARINIGIAMAKVHREKVEKGEHYFQTNNPMKDPKIAAQVAQTQREKGERGELPQQQPEWQLQVAKKLRERAANKRLANQKEAGQQFLFDD